MFISIQYKKKKKRSPFLGLNLKPGNIALIAYVQGVQKVTTQFWSVISQKSIS